jgi:RNA polymerase sigma-70 factor (ECF subfamily)
MIQSMDDEKRIFSELVDNYQKKVFQVAVGMLGNKDEALDITQDVFVKAFRSYKKFRFHASPETWLIRITINRVRDYFRKEKLKRLLFLRPRNISDNQINTMADTTQSPQEILKKKQLQAHVKAFQDGLKGREREVFSLRFGNEYTIKEISELTGISQSSVKTYLYRALDKAQNHLADWKTP